MWSGLDKNYLSEIDYIINVKNAIQFYGVVDSDNPEPNKEYLVSDNLLTSGNTLTIKPGTTLYIDKEKTIKLQEVEI